MERFTFAPARFDRGAWETAPRAQPTAPIDLRIVTWNVWFGGYQFDRRCAALLAELARRRPDVIALQEVTPPLLAELLGASWVRGAYQVSELEVIGYDVVVLSRVPIVRMMTLPL